MIGIIGGVVVCVVVGLYLWIGKIFFKNRNESKFTISDAMKEVNDRPKSSWEEKLWMIAWPWLSKKK